MDRLRYEHGNCGALAWDADSIAHLIFSLEVARHARENAARHWKRSRVGNRAKRQVHQREAMWNERSAERNHALAVGLIFGPTLAEAS